MSDVAAFLVRTGVITPAQALDVLERQRRCRPPIGQLAMRVGMLTSEQVFEVLAYQSTKNHEERFGDAAVTLGILTRAQVRTLLYEQFKRTPSFEALVVEAGFADPEAVRSVPRSGTRVAHPPRPSPNRKKDLAESHRR